MILYEGGSDIPVRKVNSSRAYANGKKFMTNNCPSQDRQERRKIENAIVLVEWSYGETYSIHPGNIKILK